MSVIRTAILGYGRSGSALHAGPVEKNKAIHPAAALRGEAHYPVTPAGALELARVLDAIRTSSDETRVVMV